MAITRPSNIYGTKNGVTGSNLSYAMPTDFYDKMKSYIPAPKALGSIESMPEYSQMMSKGTALETMPEYSKAMNFDYQLPTKPTINPEKYNTQWNISSEDISKAYNKPGGYFETAMGNLNDRGLSTSGEANRVTTTLGENLASELAKARAGIDIERMNEENALNQWYAGLEAQKAGNVASAQQNAALNLLGARSQQEQSQLGRIGDLMGLRSNRELADRDTQMNYGFGLLNASSGMANAQNQLVAGQQQAEYNRAMQERADKQAELEMMGQILGSGEYDDKKMMEVMSKIYPEYADTFRQIQNTWAPNEPLGGRVTPTTPYGTSPTDRNQWILDNMYRR